MPLGMRILSASGTPTVARSMNMDPFTIDASFPEAGFPPSATSWVPAPGTRANLGTQTIYDNADPWPALGGYVENGGLAVGQLRNLTTQGGGAFAPNYGEWGSFIITGGGHNDYYGNEVYAFDLKSLTWSCITVPGHPIYLAPAGHLYQYAAGDGIEGEMWVDAAATTTSESQPASAHMLDTSLYLPPGMPNTGQYGTFLSISRPSVARNFGTTNCAQRTHGLSLGSGSTHQWQRFATNKISDASSFLVTFPTPTLAAPRQMIYMMSDTTNQSFQSNLLYMMPLSTREWAVDQMEFGTASPYIRINWNSNLRYMEYCDLLMYWAADQYSNSGTTLIRTLRVIDPVDMKVYAPPYVGDPPPVFTPVNSTPLGFSGGEWVESRRQYAHYMGDGDAISGNQGFGYIYWLTPPSGDPRYDTWTWTRETITGPAPVASPGNPAQHYSRFRWVERFKTFLWMGSARAPMQAWTPRP